MHTVFINDKVLRFVNAYESEEWKGNTPSIFITEKDMPVLDAVRELEEAGPHPGFIYFTANADASWKVFLSYCRLIEAAGGIVMNEAGQYLIILRHKKWDLPKGKIEGEESPEEAAVREVEEECGIEDVRIQHPVSKTFHTYQLNRKRVLKKTHWFLMTSSFSGKPTPQEDEDIEIAEWVGGEEFKKRIFSNSYASIQELIRQHGGISLQSDR